MQARKKEEHVNLKMESHILRYETVDDNVQNVYSEPKWDFRVKELKLKRYEEHIILLA